MNLAFLKSNRFWSLVLLAVAWVLGQQGIISPELLGALELVLGGHVAIRTVDRFSETIAGK